MDFSLVINEIIKLLNENNIESDQLSYPVSKKKVIFISFYFIIFKQIYL